MQTRYVAYGLQLLSSFPLPGMTPDAVEGLPSVEVELKTRAELQRAWSGPDGPPRWRGRLGDGCELTIERGIEGETLFTYGSRAHFRLDASRRRIECVPLEGGLHWQQVLLGRILPNVSIAHGYEALHASAVESPMGVVAVAAPSGMGKTTLAVELMRRGWPLCADDVLVLAGGPTGVRAYPGAPTMNVAGNDSEELGTRLGMLAGEQWVAAHSVSRGDRPVRMVCLLERAPGLPMRCTPLPATPLPLAPYMLGLLGDAERERRRFSLYADLMSRAALSRLTGDLSDRPQDLADLLEESLGLDRALAARGAE